MLDCFMALDREQVEARLSEENGTTPDLSGLDLRGADLAEVDLRGANLRGASLHVGPSGLAIDNPNSPTPTIGNGDAVTDGPVADRIRQVLEERINPAIASHGGYAELVAVEGDTAYLRMGGGCQGCGMADVTMKQGIEQTLKREIPEITAVMDVTDHTSGTNPYYASAQGGESAV